MKAGEINCQGEQAMQKKSFLKKTVKVRTGIQITPEKKLEF
ncbi:MAG TPA: hypothetical protein VEC36_08130 [Patescibacteria group bacterium]|nr:hypothetical protein [Patescibacteria group bacterium]